MPTSNYQINSNQGIAIMNLTKQTELPFKKHILKTEVYPKERTEMGPIPIPGNSIKKVTFSEEVLANEIKSSRTELNNEPAFVQKILSQTYSNVTLKSSSMDNLLSNTTESTLINNQRNVFKIENSGENSKILEKSASSNSFHQMYQKPLLSQRNVKISTSEDNLDENLGNLVAKGYLQPVEKKSSDNNNVATFPFPFPKNCDLISRTDLNSSEFMYNSSMSLASPHHTYINSNSDEIVMSDLLFLKKKFFVF